MSTFALILPGLIAGAGVGALAGLLGTGSSIVIASIIYFDLVHDNNFAESCRDCDGREESDMRERTKFFSNDFLAVALFGGGGLLISLIAAVCGEQGSWF